MNTLRFIPMSDFVSRLPGIGDEIWPEEGLEFADWGAGMAVGCRCFGVESVVCVEKRGLGYGRCETHFGVVD